MMNIVKVFLIFGLGIDISYANDSLTDLMQRMKTETAVKIAYQETRTLELIDQPWQGSGFMYSNPVLMIREQLKPEHVLMAVEGDKLFYFDLDNDVCHQGEMEDDNPLVLNIAVFKALMNADEALLNRIYQVDFNSTEKDWQINLKPKQNKDSGFYITVSGLSGQQANLIKVQQADGDYSEFILNQVAVETDINTRMSKLYQRLESCVE